MSSAKDKTGSNYESFDDWWDKVGSAKVAEIEKTYLAENPDYDPDEDDGSDSGCAHRMMHEGEAESMTYDIAEQVFALGAAGESWKPNLEHTLHCDLDAVIEEAYRAGKSVKK